MTTDATRCDCGSNLDLRDVVLDSASGPCVVITLCGRCAPGALPPVPPGVAKILARRADVRLPGAPPTIRS
ncbi:hypothetical protein OG863_08925 [Streptomyces decoyicus]|uniref:Uncharacterized protein n=1 Tax=Streptomyces decoyicus TaxID=249567 RepID=A0ABZ1FCJ0_9ACTN|nr:hypothetical protein [Streptomyces decoyicus]WSB68071.1 hypothetical protein OG863_08925 [Streptomyces decoyicus]